MLPCISDTPSISRPPSSRCSARQMDAHACSASSLDSQPRSEERMVRASLYAPCRSPTLDALGLCTPCSRTCDVPPSSQAHPQITDSSHGVLARSSLPALLARTQPLPDRLATRYTLLSSPLCYFTILGLAVNCFHLYHPVFQGCVMLLSDFRASTNEGGAMPGVPKGGNGWPHMPPRNAGRVTLPAPGRVSHQVSGLAERASRSNRTCPQGRAYFI